MGDDRSDDSDNPLILEEWSPPGLEAPAPTDFSPASHGSLIFDEGAVALNATRLAVAESLLGLAVRDLSYADFMREILLVYLKAIKCEAGSLFEAEPKTGAMFFRAVAGQQSDRLDSIRIPMGKGIVGFVHESRQLTCVQDCKNDPRFLRTVGDAVGFETRNLIAAPIVIRDRVFCVVEVLNRIGSEVFSDEDITLVNYISELAAKAIEVRLMLNWAAGLKADPRKKAA
jgi:GAF domain-containing protein